MKTRKKSYRKGQLIYREGDPSDCVYIVISGRVGLTKSSPEGPVPIASAGPMEMFGEMGILDDTPRSTAAQALERAVVKIIPKAEFKVWLEQEPDAAMRVMGVLVERLRAADALINRHRDPPGVQGTVQALGTAGQLVLTNLYDAVSSWLKRRRAPPPEPLLGVMAPSLPPFLIGIASLNNDTEDGWAKALAALLEAQTGITARLIAAPLQVDPTADQAQTAAAVMRARQILGREEILDLLVWGDIHAEGYALWLTSGGPVDDDRPGAFGLFQHLELAADGEPPAGDLLALAVLAALEPQSEPHKALQRHLLMAAVRAMPDFMGSLPVHWTIEQQRTALACYGNAAATIASWENDADWYDFAAEAYRAAILRLPDEDQGIDRAILHKHLGGALLAAGERRQATELMEQAVEAYRIAAECVTRAAYPLEWAAAQNRLGQTLYKLDLLTGQPELLREALSAFQAALSVYSRIEMPHRWAEVMNNLAQVLQVYGDQMKSPEVLQRAIDACRASLEMRQRDRTPLAWGASQNTLGTALFLLDRVTESTEHLDEAAAAFTAAAEVYRAAGASRLAAVAEKNLGHVRRLMQIRNERKVVLYDWREGEDEEEF